MDRCLTILYRGPLSSCNYGCDYCPFAKHHETAAELALDRQQLERFVDWVTTRTDQRCDIFFTPWGEALTRRWYREAMVRLSWQPHVRRVAVQTNLSADLQWLEKSERERIGLWCTYHPGEVTRAKFLDQCAQLQQLSIRFSVGVVGLREHAAEIAALRAALDRSIYVWINAYKREANYYRPEEIEQFVAIDPLFRINNTRHASLGQSCRTGETVIAVDGAGDVRRCHFVPTIIGNIYEPDFEACLQPRMCPNTTCGCHIGYVHLPHLALDEVFREGILERIPAPREA